MKYIGNSAFYDCSKLKGTLNLPNSLTYIGDYAFSNCNSLTNKLILPENLQYIGEKAFSQCSGFTGALVIPKLVNNIGKQAFFQCRGFDKIEFKGSNISIGYKAFGSLHISCMSNVPSICQKKNNDDCYDTDNFIYIAKLYNNFLGERCSALNFVKWAIYLVPTLSSIGILRYAFSFLFNKIIAGNPWKKRMELIYEEKIKRAKAGSDEESETPRVNKLIEEIKERTRIESEEDGFDLDIPTLRRILEECLNNLWPTLLKKNHKRLLEKSFENIQATEDKNVILSSLDDTRIREQNLVATLNQRETQNSTVVYCIIQYRN